MIKDIHSRQARACTDLASDRRWCVSGAPISSDIRDMLAQFRFLGFQPFGLKQFFDLHVRRPRTAAMRSQHGKWGLMASVVKAPTTPKCDVIRVATWVYGRSLSGESHARVPCPLPHQCTFPEAMSLIILPTQQTSWPCSAQTLARCARRCA